ncbi:hypothetical protein CLTEP_24490 [Clostridium tepidiprofundi DSM 19306]|uniref:Thioredoxin-like fold domain-containing protein n=1 Tax=Clostridium tepidiprofundi DSM 19306 TaxID=1121338 RepID=A0A151ATU1_9CLOT|nr:thioredoxin family protein [Clostridium tepidiprofundi]KYH30992.1 hypothetical protein CLTEP_24490 [Clostridium tepidiprofundi DSM 19306]
MIIKILGSGCPKCNKTHKNVTKAINELGIDAEIIKVEDIVDIMNYGVMTTPTLVINEEVKGTGKVFSVDEVKKYIKEEL